MKTFFLLSALLLLSLQVSAQKTTTMTSNLNLSKSNFTRLVYDNSLLTPAQAETLLADADKAGIRDEAAMKQWFSENLNRFRVQRDKIKVLEVYTARESSSCENCSKTCKGRCLWEGKDECRCYSHSEPNLRQMELPQPMLIVVLTDPSQDSQVFGKSGGKGTTKSE